MVVQISPWKLVILSGGQRVVTYNDSLSRAAHKHYEPIEMPSGIWTLVDLRNHVLGGVHTSATWRIPLNRPRAAAMRPVVKLR